MIFAVIEDNIVVNTIVADSQKIANSVVEDNQKNVQLIDNFGISDFYNSEDCKFYKYYDSETGAYYNFEISLQVPNKTINVNEAVIVSISITDDFNHSDINVNVAGISDNITLVNNEGAFEFVSAEVGIYNIEVFDKKVSIEVVNNE